MEDSRQTARLKRMYLIPREGHVNGVTAAIAPTLGKFCTSCHEPAMFFWRFLSPIYSA